MNELWLSLALLLNRMLLGSYMVIVGFRKISGGIGEFVRGNFAKNTPEWLPSFIATPYGYAIPWLELVPGALLVLGLFHRPAALVMSAVLLSIAIAVGFLGPSGAYHHSVIMCGLALLLAATGPGRFSVDALRRRAGGKKQ